MSGMRICDRIRRSPRRRRRPAPPPARSRTPRLPGPDLVHRRLDVPRVRLGHGLNRDGRVPATGTCLRESAGRPRLYERRTRCVARDFRERLKSTGSRRSARDSMARLIGQPPEDVVVEREDHERHEENHADLLRDLALAQADGLPAQPLDQEKSSGHRPGSERSRLRMAR